MFNFIDFFQKNFHIENIYLINTILSLTTYIILKIFFKIVSLLNKKLKNDEKQKYIINKRNKTVFTITFSILVFIIWKKELSDIITLISFISAAVTFAVRDIIYNYFCGIYIKISKPIKIEDRIKIDDVIGDVINFNSLSFEILEVDYITNQSTGKIINIPNSKIFSSATINYNTAFKYIWDEISINITLDSNFEDAKKIFLDIINSNDVIKAIPTKMQKQIKKSNSDYRIYYNKLSPIIYTRILDNKINLTARFLIHPKKQRNVESDIFENLLTEYKKNNIFLA